MSILIISQPYDDHAGAVEWALKLRGHDVDMLFLQDFPAEITLSMNVHKDECAISVIADGVDKYRDEYAVVWNRRHAPPSLDEGFPLNEVDRKFATRIARRTYSEFLSVAYANAVWINETFASYAAINKLKQLVAAARCGFSVPETLLSNNINEIRNFVTRQPEQSIIKTFEQYQWRMDRKSLSIPTSIFDISTLEGHEESVRYSPSIFQPFIKKQYEVRATVLGEELVAAKLISKCDDSKVDWRFYASTSSVEIVPFLLPDDVKNKCIKLVKSLGLKFGCIDLICSEDDDFIFLEINQMGQFLWKEVASPEIQMLSAFILFIEREADLSPSTMNLPTWQEYLDTGAQEQYYARSEKHKPLVADVGVFERQV